jgi:hypothetical protein
MLYYLTAAGLIVHTFFWGLGLAWLALPRAWRNCAWAFAPGFGLALQSAVVWAGAHSSWPGTNAYAWWSELLPLGLLLLAAWRAGWRRARQLREDVPLLLLLFAAGWLLIAPMAQRGAWTLTSSSLGSCDQADYAAGARVFQEFSHDDRTGFLGLPEVTRVASTDYFFDFWLRLNHFTPSALIAHNSAIFGLEAYQLVSLTGAVLVLLNLPVVLLLARVMLGLRGAPLLALAALYALSPVTLYAVHHGALGQLYAAQGIGLLTLAVYGASAARRGAESVWRHAPLALAALWLLAGSYNFILIVAPAPGLAWLLADWWQRRDTRALGRTLLMLVTMFAVSLVLFWGRFVGLRERFQLFEQYNFGWPVPLLTPEGWLGLVRGFALHGWPALPRAVLGLAVVMLWLVGMRAHWRRGKDRAHALVALALVLPVAFGWSMLAWQTQTRANASYDAYKILSVFYPGLLVGLCCWLPAAQRASRRAQLEAGVLFAAVLVANASVAMDLFQRMSFPPLRVDRFLVDLGRLEKNPKVTSLNIKLDEFWTRLWANAFLLKKPQYFSVHTYEGRLNTAFKGEWDLSDSLLRMVPLNAEDFISVNDRFHVTRVAAPDRIGLSFGTGWHQLEGTGGNRWRWSSGDAQLRLNNPAPGPVRVRLTMTVIGISPRDLQLRLDDTKLGGRRLDGNIQRLNYREIVVPPGDSVLTLHSSMAPEIPAREGDQRLLSVALHGLTLWALPPPPPSPLPPPAN